MVQKYVKSDTIHTITKDGECKVQIDIRLDINVNQSGITVKESSDEPEPVNWEIPDFTAAQKLKFFGEEIK